jgi:hypothetical protein
MIVAPLVTLDFCSGSLRSAGTHQCIRVSTKGARIMGQVVGGIFGSYGARSAPSSPPNSSIRVAMQLYKYPFGYRVNLRKLAWQSG